MYSSFFLQSLVPYNTLYRFKILIFIFSKLNITIWATKAHFAQNRFYCILFKSRWLEWRFNLHWNEQVQSESNYNISSCVLFRPVIWQFPWMSLKSFIRLNVKAKRLQDKNPFKTGLHKLLPQHHISQQCDITLP